MICEKLKICGSLIIIPSVRRERCQARFQNAGPLICVSLTTEKMQAFFIFSYLVQSTAKYFKPVHPPCHTPNEIFPPPPPPFSFSLGKSPGNAVEPCSKVF